MLTRGAQVGTFLKKDRTGLTGVSRMMVPRIVHYQACPVMEEVSLTSLGRTNGRTGRVLTLVIVVVSGQMRFRYAVVIPLKRRFACCGRLAHGIVVRTAPYADLGII